MIAALVASLAASLPATSAPWEAAPFTAEPAALAAAAEALAAPRGAPVDVLVEEGTYRLDARGAATFTYRRVFRPLGAEAARRWARVEHGWAPWHQARPEIRARVVSPQGEATVLDPATLAEQGAAGGSPEVWSDRRVLGGPLPGVRPGSIVEEVTTLRDERPFFDGGVVHRFWMGQPSPIRLWRLVVEAPEALPLRWKALGIELRPVERVAGGTRTLVFERRDAPAAVRIDPAAPRDVPPAPVVLFGWGRSWREVAARYGALWERQLAGADVRAAAKAAIGGRTGREEVVRGVLAWIHENVRYSGLELGDAEVVPAPPAETLRRRYGDCKDLSLLTVALLREAGIAARIALLDTGWQDLVPELPGLGQFDHAIVRVEGREPLWVDPTDRYTPPGRLPPSDQGRLALVTGPGQERLVRTPEPGPEENAAQVVRELHLAELGPGRVVERRTLTGALAAAERAYRERGPDGHADLLDERYAREVFRAETFLGVEVKGERDLAAPLEVRVEADRSALVETVDDGAEVPVTPDPVFDPLPRFLTGRGQGEAEREEPLRPRSQDLVLALPYRYEVVYRVFPPDGFRARPLPADASERFGPATYTQRYAIEKDGSVTAAFRFESGGRRFPAADADALQRRVREIVRGRSPRISFERVAAALLASGRVAEALAEIERLMRAHPREAMHRLHLALSLLQLGLAGEAAAEARTAIALEPDRAWAHRVLGWVLEHDVVGRLHGPGFDRAGAIAAYEAARAKDPRHAGGRAALAELLAHDPSGVRHGPGADLPRAIEEYRSIRDELGDHHHDAGLLAALFAAGRHGEALALAREMSPGGERNAILVAAAAAEGGAAKGEAEADALGDGRREALRGAAGFLVRQRRHAPAAALASAAARGAPNAAELFAQAETFSQLRPWEKLRDEGDEALRTVKRLFVAVVASQDPAAELAELLPARTRGEARRTLEAGLPLTAAAAQRSLRESGVPRDVFLDLVLSKLEVVRDGDARRGLRLRVRSPFDPVERGSAVYLVAEGGALRIAATDVAWPLLGAEAERSAAAGDLATARRWLDWAREAVPGEEGDPSSPAGILSALRGGGELASVQRAGAALAAFADAEGRTVAPLEAARAAAREPAERRALSFALCQAHRARGDARALLAVADELLAADPASRPAFAAKAWALRRLGERAALWPAADAILAHLPDDPDVLGMTGSMALLMGDAEGAARAWRRVIDAGRATPVVYNNAAWLELFRDPSGKNALDWARRAVDQGRQREHASQNTLAAAYAEAGKAAEAREIFLRSLEGGGPLGPADWYVFGRIAEAWGRKGAAREAYGRVEPEKEEGADDPASAYHLARRRLDHLGRPAAGDAPAATPPPRAKEGSARDRTPKPAPPAKQRVKR